MAVVFLERIASALGRLLPQRRAIKVGAGLTTTDHPDESLVGATGGEGQVTGYIEIAPDTAVLATRAWTLTELAALETAMSLHAPRLDLTSSAAATYTGSSVARCEVMFRARVASTVTAVAITPSKPVTASGTDWWKVAVYKDASAVGFKEIKANIEGPTALTLTPSDPVSVAANETITVRLWVGSGAPGDFPACTVTWIETAV